MIKHITESEALYFAGQQEHKDKWRGRRERQHQHMRNSGGRGIVGRQKARIGHTWKNPSKTDGELQRLGGGIMDPL